MANNKLTPSPVRKKRYDPRKTGIAMENAFWSALEEIANTEHTSPAKLIRAIDREREHQNLSSVVRVYILNFFRNRQMSRSAKR
jgi:predicted DNA-binding ribbon-helix-helix protein